MVELLLGAAVGSEQCPAGANAAANCCSSSVGGNPGAHAAPRDRRLAGLCATSSPPPRSRGERARLCHAAPADGHRRGHSRAPAGSQRGAARAARRRAGSRRSTAFCASAGLASIEQCEVRDTGSGEFYFAVIKRPGRADGRGAAGAAARRDRRAAVAEIDALPGRVAALGAAADFGHLPVRRRGAAAAARRGAGRPDDARPPLPVTGRDLRSTTPPITWQKLGAGPCRARPGPAPADHRGRISKRPRADEGLDVKPDPGPARRGHRPRRISGRARRRDRRRVHGAAARGAGDRDAHAPEIFLLPAARRHARRRDFCSSPTTVAADDGKTIVAGNERVLRARLADARFFWDQDRKSARRAASRRCQQRVFHAKLGSVYDKVERMEKLAEFLADHVPGADRRAVAARGAPRQGRPVDRHGRRISRAARGHGPLLRAAGTR